jgi:replicative DNA helicase
MQNNFDKHFEEKVITAMVVDSSFAEQVSDVIELKYFELNYTIKIAKIMMDHFKNYETFPSLQLIESIIKREENDDALREQCVGFINQIKKKTDFNDLDYVKDKCLEFFRVKNLYKVLDEEILPRLENGSTKDLEEISTIVQKAIAKGTEKNLGYSYTEDESQRFLLESLTKVPTPWDYMNLILNGGWEGKRLITAIGSSGAGKSHLCSNVGVGALLSPKEDGSGRTVVHYTLELSDLDVARRYDARLTDVEINSVVQNKEKILFTLKKKLPPGAKLIIKEYPMKSASISTIKSHLAQLKIQGIIPDLIIIDYGDLLKPVDDPKEKRHGLESIWMDMKALAQIWNVPVFTVTQTNRSGYNSDIITPDQVSEDFSKIMHSDIIFTIARNMEQKTLGVGKVYIAKNRQGQDSQILYFKLNTAKSFVDICELDEDLENEIAEAKAKEELNKKEDVIDILRKSLKEKK